MTDIWLAAGDTKLTSLCCDSVVPQGHAMFSLGVLNGRPHATSIYRVILRGFCIQRPRHLPGAMVRHEQHQSVVASEESNWVYLEWDLEGEIVLWLMNLHSINADGGEEVQLHVEVSDQLQAKAALPRRGSNRFWLSSQLRNQHTSNVIRRYLCVFLVSFLLVFLIPFRLSFPSLYFLIL